MHFYEIAQGNLTARDGMMEPKTSNHHKAVGIGFYNGVVGNESGSGTGNTTAPDAVVDRSQIAKDVGNPGTGCNERHHDVGGMHSLCLSAKETFAEAPFPVSCFLNCAGFSRYAFSSFP